MAKNILLILGHPSENSFCKALLDAYQDGAERAGANCKTIYVSQLDFNVSLSQHQILKDIVFGYVGFDPIRFSTFGFMRKSTDRQRVAWLKKVQQLGRLFK